MVTRILPPLAQEKIESLKTEFDIYQWSEDGPIPRDILFEQVKDAEGLLCLITDKIDKELLSYAKKLKVVSTVSVGYDHIYIGECKRLNIPVGNTPGVLTDACADLSVGLLLAIARRFEEGVSHVKNGTWGNWSTTWMCGSQFTGKTVGIFGLGRIGEAIAMRMAPFGISKIVYNTASGPKKNVENKVKQVGQLFSLKEFCYVDFDTFLQESDVIYIASALNAKTAKIFNKDAFEKMKQGAILVNTARGAIIDMHDLEQELLKNKIIAALDVTDPEPLPPSSNLLKLNNCLVLPHLGSATVETRNKMGMMAIENLLAGLNGKPLLNEVK